MTAYRKHFIRLNILLIGAVLLTALTLVGAYILRNEYENMRQTMFETLEPFRGEKGSFSFTPDPSPDGSTPPDTSNEPLPENAPVRQEHGTPPPPSQNIQYSASAFSRCITVFFDNGKATVISGAFSEGESDILSAAETAITMEERFGYLKDGDLFYMVLGQTESAKISLLPARYLRASVLQTVLYLLAAFLLTMLTCYFISRYISQLAVRPVEQAMSREKQFVADISHDLKTPLSVIQACNHILAENPEKSVAESQAWLDRSDAAISNMKSLIDDMLTLSAMDAVQRLPKQEKVNLSGIVTKAILQMEVMAYDHSVVMESDVQENIFVTGDAEALLRVISGLIENALKYESQNGRILVKLYTHGKKAVFSVRNFGAFISPEDLPHIFERFYRGDKARTSQQGHGLGLAIIRRTVELMNGKIEAESSSETGTVFTLTLECC